MKSYKFVKLHSEAKTVDAIKFYRQITGQSLREACDAIRDGQLIERHSFNDSHLRSFKNYGYILVDSQFSEEVSPENQPLIDRAQLEITKGNYRKAIVVLTALEALTGA